MTNEVTHLKSSGTGWELQEQIQTTSCLWKKRRKLSKHEMKNEAWNLWNSNQSVIYEHYNQYRYFEKKNLAYNYLGILCY